VAVTRTELTEAQVAGLRRDYLAGTSIAVLAGRAGVGESTVRGAVHGVTWRWVTDPPPVPVADVPGACVLDEDAEREVVRLRDTTGLSWARIGARVGVASSTAARAYRRARAEGIRA